jgi:histidine triad (HIT) family protein
MSCVFCEIIKGNSTASRIFEDDDLIVILDLFPVTIGHSLVIPKQHVEFIAETDKTVSAKMFTTGIRISEAIRKSGIKPDGINLHLSDGRAAGQEIPHTHLHIIPRFRGDGSGFRFNSKSLANREELNRLAENIKNNLPSP